MKNIILNVAMFLKMEHNERLYVKCSVTEFYIQGVTNSTLI